VAHFALLRDASRRVIRIRGALVILHMTRNTRGRVEVVVSVHMTQTALHIDVRPGQRKRGLRMVKRGGLPSRSCVTHVAGLRDSGGKVIRIGRPLIVLHVARHARGRCQIEIGVGVTLIALQLGMSASQRETHRVVIEICRRPGRSGVTILASLRQSQSKVTGIVGLLKIRQVTAHTRRRRPFILSARVTGHAIQTRVHARQRKAGELQVIEFRAQPRVDRVTLLALRRETRRNVIRFSRLLIRALVAGVALDRQSLELPNRLALVTIGAI